MYDIVIATAKYIERGLNKFMQKHSKLWILFHHPFGVVGRTILVLFVILVLLESQSIYVGETASKILLCISFFIGLCLTQRKYNREEMYPSQKSKKKHSFFRFLFSSAMSANSAMNRRQKAMEDAMTDGITDWFKGNSRADDSWRQAQREADRAARARYDARDRMKKAEYDARDAALRGKDKAAYQYKNQADYWYNESKKY